MKQNSSQFRTTKNLSEGSQNLIELAQKIKPVMTFKWQEQQMKNGLYFLQAADILWHNFAPNPIVSADRLEQCGSVQIEYTPMERRYFAVPVASVLSQIPEKWYDKAVAYELRGGNLLSASRWDEETNKCVYMADVILYSGKLPPEIAAQPVIFNGKIYETPQIRLVTHHDDKNQSIRKYVRE